MAWTAKYSDTALRQLSKLDRQLALRILNYVDSRVIGAESPRQLGKALTGPMGGLWRYRVGDYRVICDIQDDVLVVLVVTVGNRGDVYR